jgi:endonuclease-8
MPEGPEIRRAADRLAAVLEQQVIEEACFGLPRLERFGPALCGTRVEALETRGKALLTRFSSGLTLYTHNQLYGRWYVAPRGHLPATGRTLRVALHTAAHSALLYSASDIEVLTPEELGHHPFLLRLGPDVLDGRLTWQDVAARLRESHFAGRALSSLYLDQGFLAGIGNYLRSEILHHAGLAPSTRPRELTPAALGRLARSTLTISRRAYRTGGITNPPSRVRSLRARGVARSDYRFAVFDREDQTCYRCGSRIARGRAGARRLYYCPQCQADDTLRSGGGADVRSG